MEEQMKPYIDVNKKLNSALLAISKHAKYTLSQLSTEVRVCYPKIKHKEGNKINRLIINS